ncbi:HAD family hydrolase [Nocardia goodfellowii]|uniref:Hydrolase of the HAD superfamily n=1 Tax=Nocardia goodfellowii TaxID=882446 RepID=A0ABS4QP25_9NOCA|nr:HAD family hydrolase [Nocardia goodfellowii]MBP2193461.1 putative hydrolase of the HAD superfamily [Nocardia goodfellowii]
MTVRAVLWDVDDTLFDYSESDRAGVLRHLAAEGLLDAHGGPEPAVRRWQAIMEAEFARFLAGEVDIFEHRRCRARVFLGIDLPDAEADAWFNRYIAHYQDCWTLFPDSAAALATLAPRFRQAVLSNSSVVNQERKLQTLDIRGYFEAVLCADELGYAKPDAAAFHAACAALDLPPGEVAYVGDRLDIDALGARDAGLTAVWLDRAGSGVGVPAGVLRITSLSELSELLHFNSLRA